MKKNFSVITGVGGKVPGACILNSQLPGHLETSDEWIRERTGIGQRYVVSGEETTASLGLIACEEALRSAKKSPQDIDLILVATSTPDHIFPPVAMAIQKSLGANHAVAFDINVACSGFLFALTVADAYIKQGIFQKILVVGAETMSQIVDWSDRRTAVLFGDGAGAFLMEAFQSDTFPVGKERGILGYQLKANSQGYHSLYAQRTVHCSEMAAASASMRASSPSSLGDTSESLPSFSDDQTGQSDEKKCVEENIDNVASSESLAWNPLSGKPSYGSILMNGADVFRHAVQSLEEVSSGLLKKMDLCVEDLDWVIPHQANKRILDAVSHRLNIPSEKMIFTGDLHANTSSASIPLAWWSRCQDIKSNQLVLLLTFGAGYTWGGLVLRT